MKINRISLNCRRSTSVNNDKNSDSVFYLFRSPVIFNINGSEKRFVNNSAVIFTSGCKQDFRSPDSHPIRYDCVSFRISSADRQYISSMNIPLNSPIEIKDDFIISNTLKSMKSKFLGNGNYFSEFMELSMRIIFISMSDTNNGNQVLQIPKYAELKSLRESIYDEPMNEWSVDEMCFELGISKTYFHRLYMEAFGVTCRQDVIESRLLYASELLKNTDLSVSEIAEQCGYESDSYFMRQFKQHKGCTPSKFRCIQKENNNQQ